MSQPAKNIDDLLFSANNQNQPLSVPESVPDPISNESLPEKSDYEVEKSPLEPTPEKTIHNDSNAKEPEQTKESGQIDDFGTPIEPKKERVYTEAEVNQMMRDRLARVKQERDAQPIQQTQQEVSQDSEGWETQLEQFIDNTLTKREQHIQHKNWQQQEQQRQAEFEIKFNSGAERYSDFESVVSGKPLTADMVLATRGMSDPAAFIYAAAKTQATELKRISEINDPVQVGIELGRLEERMKKSRGSVSNAPRPNIPLTGDSVHKTKRELTIDEKIAADAKRMRR